MTATLTDRYVYAVARSLPETRRDDVERELRATIADDVDARVDAGASPDAAERAALEALGDPARLVAGYLDRPLHLIGPAHYLTWVRLLRLLLIVVLPFAAAGMVIAQLIAGTPPGGIIGSTIGLLITVAVHLAFWTAFVFWMIERTEQRTKLAAYRLDDLPTPPVQGAPPFSQMVVIVAFLVLFAVVIVGQQFVSGFSDESGSVIPVLVPELWSWAIPLILLLVALEIGVAIWLWKAARWTVAHVVVNALIALAAIVLALYLITGPGLYNPEWFAQFGADDKVDPLHLANIITAVTVVGVGLWDAIEGLADYIRQLRAARLKGSLTD
jgi:hypothetical protein